jgi:hypothetical protein
MSKGDWHAEEQDGNLYVYLGTPGVRRVIVALADVHPADDVARETARRIVACVNACRDIPTEALETYPPGDFGVCWHEYMRPEPKPSPPDDHPSEWCDEYR